MAEHWGFAEAILKCSKGKRWCVVTRFRGARRGLSPAVAGHKALPYLIRITVSKG